MSMPFDMLLDREPIFAAQNLLKELTRLSGTDVKIIFLVNYLVSILNLLLSPSLSSQHRQLELPYFCLDLKIASWQL